MTDRRLSDPLYLAIAHPTRRAMLELLVERGETSVDELHAELDLPPAVASQHLRVLIDAELAAVRRDGRRRLYRITPEPLLEIAGWIHSFERIWRDQPQRLREHLDAASAAPPLP